MELSTLITMMQSNDFSVWDEFYNTTYKDTYHYALRLTANHEDAEDLAQKAYIKAYRSINSIDKPKAFKGWMSKIILNEFSNDKSRFQNTISRAKNTVEFEEKNYDPTETYTQNFLPAYMVEQQDTRQILIDCIDHLSLPQRVCILLFYFSNMPIADIATTLNCSQNTVKSRLNYGKKHLKDKISALEKRDGIRIHSFVPLGLLFAKDLSSTAAQITIPPFDAVKAATATTATTTTAVKTGILATAKVKVVAAVTAAAVMTGGVAYIASQRDAEPPVTVIEEVPEQEAPEVVEELPIVFADANIEDAVRLALNIPDDNLYSSDLERIYMFTIDKDIFYFNSAAGTPVPIPSSLADLDQFTYLSCFVFFDMDASILDSIPTIPTMEVISFYPNSINDIESYTWLHNFPNLNNLNISGCGDFSMLNEFQKLEHLYILAGQDLTLDISQLQNLQTIALTPAELMGSTNVISSTSLPNLQLLSISPSDSLEVLSNTPNLRVLSVQSWEELNPEPITSLSNLEWLSYNIPGSTQDLSLLSACPNLIYCGLTDTMTATLPEAVTLDLGLIDPYGNEIRMMLYDEITGSVSN